MVVLQLNEGFPLNSYPFSRQALVPSGVGACSFLCFVLVWVGVGCALDLSEAMRSISATALLIRSVVAVPAVVPSPAKAAGCVLVEGVGSVLSGQKRRVTTTPPIEVIGHWSKKCLTAPYYGGILSVVEFPPRFEKNGLEWIGMED